jgi:hypothetical protein
MLTMDCGTGKAAAKGEQWQGQGRHVDEAMMSSCYDKSGGAAEGSVFSFVSYGKVQYEGGLWSFSNTHTQTHLGHKTSFLRVENMWIFGK